MSAEPSLSCLATRSDRRPGALAWLCMIGLGERRDSELLAISFYGSVRLLGGSESGLGYAPKMALKSLPGGL